MISKSEIYQILSRYELPDYVKRADYDQYKTFDESKAWFADPIYRKYPCFDPVSTILSACKYFAEKDNYTREHQKIIESNLSKIASLFDIESDYLSIKKQAESPQAREIYALEIVDNLTGRTTKAYPVNNEKEAKMAIRYLINNWHEIAPHMRQKIASNILQICDREGFNLGITKVACEILARKNVHLTEEGFRSVCSYVKYTAQQLPNLDLIKESSYQNLDKLAESPIDLITKEDVDFVLDGVQALASIVPSTLRPNLPPEFSIFIHKDDAERIDRKVVKLANGYAILEPELANISLNDLKKYFYEYELPQNFVPCTSSIAKFAASLDVEGADRFMKLVKDKNLRFVRYKKLEYEIPTE